ncbi:MAG: hypothetical protein ACT4O2_13725 [Beijerinckiaceae bacterium]
MSGAPNDLPVIHTLPSSNAAGTSDTVALPVQGVSGGVPLPVSGTFWQTTQPVSASALPLPSGAAQDGTDASGVTPPSGGSGIRGWLSGIYIKLNGTLAGTSATNGPPIQGMTGGVPVPVSGTFWQATQPVSTASLPLPSGAAQDGTDATDVLPPAGAVGIRGWLSGIYSKLASSVSVTGTFWQATQPVSAASLPLPAGAATAVNQPTAAAQGSTTSGQTGRLVQGAVTAAAPAYVTAQTSPISLTLAGAVRTDASATTQPISAASLPLPAGAATAAGVAAINTTLGTPMQATGGIVGIAAGTNAIGSIIGRTSMVTATPAVTSNGAYAAGNEIGGLMTFAIGGAGSGTLMSMRVTSRSVLSTALKAYIFSANPASTTWTDNTAPAINAADIVKLLAVIPLNAPDNGLGTHTLWELGGIATQFVAANLYVVLVTVSAATLTSGTASDFTVQLGVSDD